MLVGKAQNEEACKERFLLKTKQNIETGCIEWVASVKWNGYGQVRFRGTTYSAHRASYLLFKGEIPEGLHVCHRCDNRICVNPEHLFLGTRSDNMKDCSRKGRLKPGHLFKGGENNFNSKLSNSARIEVASLFNSGSASARKIAKMFSINVTTVYMVLKRRK